MFHIDYIKINKNTNIIKFKESQSEAVIPDSLLSFFIENKNSSFAIQGECYINIIKPLLIKNEITKSFYIYVKSVNNAFILE